jgi:hypothetical protein
MSNDNTEVLHTLKRIEELLTALTRAALSDSIERHLADPNHRILYEGAGQFPVTELAKKTGLALERYRVSGKNGNRLAYW